MKSIPTLLLALGGILGTSAFAQVPGGPATNLRPALSLSVLRIAFPQPIGYHISV